MSLHAEVRLRRGPLDIEVTLDVEGGEVVGLVGPNGAGKTTVLRALAGLTPLDAGTVVLDGRVLEDAATGVRLPAEERSVGVVFQDLLLFPHLSALENVAFGSDRRRASRWLGRLGLTEVARHRPHVLSGGEAQRVALARALARDPALLLLDEPLSSLDVGTRQHVRRELRHHLGAFTGPTVLVTHEPIEAIALADRLVVLEDGRTTQDGPVDDVARRPRSPWVAELVGLNLYRGRAADGTVAIRGGGRLVAPTSPNGEVFAVVHPRAVAVHRSTPEGSPRNVWPGTVSTLDVQGDRARVEVSGSPTIVAEVTPAAVAGLDLAAGGRVWVSVKASEVEVYPV